VTARSADDAARRKAWAPDLRLSLGLAASLVAVGVACRELLHFQPLTHMHVSLTGRVEDFFFEPSDSSPLAVLLLCGWLLWRRRHRLAALWGRSGSPWVTVACWLLAAGLFAWSIRTGAPDLQGVALIPALLGAGNLLGGPAALRVMAPPTAVLLFVVPLPGAILNQVVWALQIGTAAFTGQVLRLVGLPVVVSGDRILLNDGLFAIIETCSGIRSLETLALLTVLMIDLFGRRGWHAVALLVVAPLVALLVNGFRCVGLIFNPHADVASIHSLQGIAMLLGGVLLLYFIDGWLARWLPSPDPVTAFERRARTGPAPRPLGARVAGVAGFSSLLLALSFLPPFQTHAPQTRTPHDVLDERFAGWEGTREATDWLFLGTTVFGQTDHVRYALGGSSVDVFLGQADSGRRPRSYLSPKVAFPDSGWEVVSEQRTWIAGREATLRVLRKGESRVLSAHWFEASPGWLAEGVRGLFALDASPLARDRVPLAVRVSTPLRSSRPAAVRRGRNRLERVAQRLVPGLDDLIFPQG
jgi:exosortase